jgi:hypothetical protein
MAALGGAALVTGMIGRPAHASLAFGADSHHHHRNIGGTFNQNGGDHTGPLSGGSFAVTYSQE